MLDLNPLKGLYERGKSAANENLPRVAVIGAGIAGMTAARILADHGFSVTVFEQEKVPGGRAATCQHGGMVFDHGCSYFVAHDKRFQTVVDALIKRGVVSPWSARRVSCLHGVIHPVEDDDVLYVGTPGMNAIASAIGEGLDVRLDTIVSAIKKTNQGWKLTVGGKRETFDLVVVSAPADDTARLLSAVPLIAKEAARVEMQPCWSAMVGFEAELNAPFDAAHFTSCPIVWAANQKSKPGRPRNESWVIQASAEWTKQHSSSPEDMVGKIMVSSFFQASGIAPVAPGFLRMHRWYRALPADALLSGFLWDKDEGVGACGDWCHSARVEGAFISGSRIAETIIKDCSTVRQLA